MSDDAQVRLEFTVPPGPTAERPVRTAWSRQLFASGEEAVTASGRRTAPFPTVSTRTDRAAAATLRRVDGWLVAEARAELSSIAARPRIEFFLTGVEGADAANLSTADRETFDAILFDPDYWD